MSISKLINKQIPGSSKTKSNHIKRGERIAQMINERFLISSPYQWQVKHLKWFMEVLSRDIENSTLYDYWLTTRKIGSCLGKWQHWQKHLPNPKHCAISSKGGRKPLLSNKKTFN